MKLLPRRLLRKFLAGMSSRPWLKRHVVDLVYRIPWLDTRLRNLAQRVVHAEAVLDVDLERLPEGSRLSLARIRARMPR